MPSPISSETRAAILALHANSLSYNQISNTLSNTETPASKTTVIKTIKEFKLRQQGIVKPAKKLGTQNLPSVRTPAFIRKVKNLVDRADPFTIRQIAI
jgi:hypothetical protein